MKKIKIFTYLNGFIITLSGILTLLSSYYGFAIFNFIVGLFFILSGIFITKRGNSVYQLLEILEEKDSQTLKNFIFYESLLSSVILFFSLIILSGVYHRIFVEHFSIFG